MPVKNPESPRAIALNGQRVDYLLRRSNRRSIGLSIDQRGLRVAAPLRATLRDVENLIQQHANWVLDKHAEWRERPATAAQPITDG
jgi:predicted metal-dependent hydrolase